MARGHVYQLGLIREIGDGMLGYSTFEDFGTWGQCARLHDGTQPTCQKVCDEQFRRLPLPRLSLMFGHHGREQGLRLLLGRGMLRMPFAVTGPLRIGIVYAGLPVGSFLPQVAAGMEMIGRNIISLYASPEDFAVKVVNACSQSA